ncbi:MAG: hypothetical protein V2A69_15930 [Pseudomonadota bacterium]
MAISVGEVLTFFEGKADGLFKTIEEAQKKLDKFAQKVYSVKVDIQAKMPKDLESRLSAITKNVAPLKTAITSMSKDINTVAESVLVVIKRVSGQAQDQVSTVMDTANKRVEKGFEIMAARGSAILMAWGGIKLTGSFLNLIKTIKVSGASVLTGFFAQAKSVKILLSEVIPQMSFIQQSFASFVSLFSVGMTSFFTIPFLLLETYSLTKRIFGVSLLQLTPLEHASRLVSMIDVSLSRGYVTAMGLKTAFGGLAVSGFLLGFQNSFLMLPAFFNIAISGILAGWNWLTRKIGTSLGSGRSAFNSLMFDVRAILLDIVPVAAIVAKEIRKLVPRGIAQKIIGIVASPFATIKGMWGWIQGKKPTTILTIIDMIKGLPALFATTKKSIEELLQGASLRAKTVVLGIIQIINELKKLNTVQVSKVKPSQGVQTIDKTFQATQQATAKTVDIFSQQMPVALAKVARSAQQYGTSLAVIQQQTTALAEKSVDSYAKIGTAIRVIETPILGMRAALVQAIKEILDFSKVSGAVFAGKGKSGGAGPFGGFANITTFGNYAKKTAEEGKTSFKDLEKSLMNLFNSFKRIQEKLGTGSKASLSSLAASMQKGIEKGFNVDPAKLKTRFIALEKVMDDLGKTMPIKGKNLGEKITSMLAQGIGANAAKVEKAVEKLAQIIADFFPLSPPKRGPLVNIVSSGSKIVNYLSQGMQNARNQVGKSAGAVAETIARYFPRSLPVVGALVALPAMGAKIAFYLASGILTGRGVLARAAGIMADVIMSPLEQLRRVKDFLKLTEITQASADIKQMAERTGQSVEFFSSLGHAVEQVGGNFSELSFVFKGLQEKLNDALYNPLSDTRKELESLGIDFSQVASSGNPLLSLFYSLTHAAKTFTDAGERGMAKVALNLLSIIGDSKLINLVLQGPDGIQDFLNSAVKLGAVLSATFAKTSLEFTQIQKRWSQVRDSIRIDFISSMLPALNAGLQSILGFIESNRTSIAVFLQISGEMLMKIAEAIKAIFKMVVENPGEAFGKLKNLAWETLILIANLLEITWGALKLKLSPAISELSPIFQTAILPVFIDLALWIIEKAFWLGGVIIAKIPEVIRVIFDRVSLEVSAGFRKLVEKNIPFVSGIWKALGGKTDFEIEQLNIQLRALGSNTTTSEPGSGDTESLKKQLQETSAEAVSGLKKLKEELEKVSATPGTKINFLEELKTALADFQKEVEKTTAGTPLEKLSTDMQEILDSWDAKTKEVEKKVKKQQDIIEKAAKSTAATIKTESDAAIKALQHDMEKLGINELADAIKYKAKNTIAEVMGEFQKISELSDRIFLAKGVPIDEQIKELDTLLAAIAGNLNKFKESSGINAILEEALSPAQKLTLEFEKQVKSWDALYQSVYEVGLSMGKITKETAQMRAAIVSAKEAESSKYFAALHSGTIGALTGAFETALNTFLEKGKVTMEDFSSMMKATFQESFKTISEFMKNQLGTALASVFEALGAEGELGQGLVAGIVAVGAYALSRLKDQVTVVHNAVVDTVQQTEQMRGVIAGERTIGIMEVVDRLMNVNQPMIWRLDTMISVLREISGKLGGPSVAGIGYLTDNG